MIQRVIHPEDGIDRALLRTGDVSGDVDHWLEVLVIDARLERGLFRVSQLTQRHRDAIAADELDLHQLLQRRLALTQLT